MNCCKCNCFCNVGGKAPLGLTQLFPMIELLHPVQDKSALPGLYHKNITELCPVSDQVWLHSVWISMNAVQFFCKGYVYEI